jgi:hypothetical protein
MKLEVYTETDCDLCKQVRQKLYILPKRISVDHTFITIEYFLCLECVEAILKSKIKYKK